ncbi:protein kinase C-like protein [Pneumocystis jirovecii RU7]|uniref:protein kinase C n=1 Tax=Pneumocystis jirovecii (strain RU7) TaxID=1408657 RepID=A0A0W4ZFH3_PNEJ7|nr:protein kinase C-like protein [Pneumocystis jirovecii RU7]KTW27139.1 protein kinase C-like protein [Pneumocystis jirovecii RU7]
MTDMDDKIRDIYQKIEREKVLIQGAQAMRSQTENETVQQSLENNIRESQRNIAYLEKMLHELQLKKKESLDEQKEQDNIESSEPPTSNDVFFSETQKIVKENSIDNLENAEKVSAEGLLVSSKSTQQYTKLDLFKYYTPYTSVKIQTMLQLLEFKLTVEKQVKDGFDKLIKLYQNENDKKNRNEAELKRIQSVHKIQLLKRALKRYENLHIDIDKDSQNDNEKANASSVRGLLSGIFKGKVYAIQDVEHVNRTSRTPETYIVIKVDKTEVTTRMSKTDRWQQESFEIEANKVNEVEFVVYDKQGSSSIPIAILYIQISDIAEELRQNRIKEVSGPDWVSAEKMQNNSGRISPAKDASDITSSHSCSSTFQKQSNISKEIAASEDKSIDTWFSLEPAGQIHLSLNFVKNAKNQRPNHKLGLGRQGAIREKKKTVYEVHGHSFAQHQFYQIIKCAFCSEFLKNAIGFRCIDCRYTCHKKCYLKVITKCISKINSSTDLEEKLNHHIPHRFELVTNIGANWCCHCGYILPLGKKNAQKCLECSILCHTQCRHFIPNLCGMSMEVANQILNEIKITKLRQSNSFNIISKKVQNGFSHENDKNEFKAYFSSKNFSQATFNSFQNTDESHFKSQDKQTSYSSDKTILQKNVSDIINTQETREPWSSFSTHSTFAKNAFNVSDNETTQSSALLGNMSSDLDLDHSSTSYQGVSLKYENEFQKQENQENFLRDSSQSITSYQEKNVNITYQANDNKYSYNYNRYSENLYTRTDESYSSDSSTDNYQLSGNVYVNKPASYLSSMKTKITSFDIKKVGLDDFNFLAVLGKGNFGKVMLAETKSTKQLYAIKVLKKESIIENEEIGSTASEKRIFLAANKGKHPFLINMHSCFQSESRIYFVMEYVSGGDLLLHIQREQFGQMRAQFYAAEVLLALKHFHENGIVYRDLKLDNILLCVDGHIKVTDYGLCKEDMWYGSTTNTFCGTPEFMAPEILYEQPYGRAVDWWAFGVLIYQMLLGQSPFRGEDEDEIFDAIQSDEPLYPIHMPRESVSILQRLLTKDPDRRLGSGPSDALEVMAHPFFRNINWDDIYHKRVHPPYFPKVVNAVDTSNFDVEFTPNNRADEPPILTPVQSILTQAMQEQFRGFSIYCGDP